MFLFNEIVSKNQHQTAQKTRYSDIKLSSGSQWVTQFVAAKKWIVPVDDVYLNDNFNLIGLSTKIGDQYTAALKAIRSQQYVTSDSRGQELQKTAEDLYSLIHARYLLTFNGVKDMQMLYEKEVFGNCPRVACNNQALLPIGLSPDPGENVKTFCPCCQDIYDTEVVLDGAFFGPSFAHFFVQALRDEITIQTPKPMQMTFMGVPVDSSMCKCRHIHD